SRDGVVSDSGTTWNGSIDRPHQGSSTQGGNNSLFWDVVCDLVEDASKCATTESPREDGNITMDSNQATQTGHAVVYALAVGFNLLLLYMSIFGQRMTWRAIRWHIINVSVWNIVGTVFYASFSERTPWADYIHNQGIEDYYAYIKQFCFTAFHNGMILVFIESLIVFFCPSLDNSFFFSLVWFLLICVFANGAMLFCFLARIVWGSEVDKMFWYDPMCLYQVVIVLVFGVIIIPVYILCAIIASVLSCICRMKQRGRHHFELWSTLIYGLIPYPAFILTTGFMFAQFITLKYPEVFAWAQEIMMNLFRKPPAPGNGGTGGTGGNVGAPSFVEILRLLGEILNFFVELITWTEASLPLLEAILAIVFFLGYFQQFLFIISCGRFFNGKRRFDNEVRLKKAPPPMLFYPSGILTQKELPPAQGSTEKVVTI
ncbi:hypothetical protein PFISCL1PPCAC_16033, partial [Pristionchus fissidentatus]